MKPLFLFVIANAFVITTNASVDFNKRCSRALLLCFELNLNEATKLVNEEKIENPQNCYSAYISNYIDCINIALNEDEAEYNKLKDNKKKNIAQITANCDKTRPYYRFLQAEINLQWAFIRIKFGDYLSAALEINKAYNLLVENEKLHPTFYLNKKSLGLMHSLIGTVPDEYQWAVSMLGFKGTILQGTNELKRAYTACLTDTVNKVYLHEIVLFRTFVEGNLLNNKNNLQILLNDLNTIENTPITLFCKASLQIKNGNNDKAITLLQNAAFSSNQKHFYYLDFLLGDCKLKRLDKDADKYLLRYILNYKGKSFLKAANLRLWWHSILHNKINEQALAKANIEKVGNAIIDEDKQALNEIKQNTLPNISLLKTRLLFDGGYYDKALKELNQVTKAELTHKNIFLEYVYRIARILDKQEKEEKAIPFYELAIKNGEQEPLYFAASAALHLGNIYEKNGDNNRAVFYYKKCQALKNHAYKNSLSQKAKAGINRINKQ